MREDNLLARDPRLLLLLLPVGVCFVRGAFPFSIILSREVDCDVC
jgi:hypothetical protein